MDEQKDKQTGKQVSGKLPNPALEHQRLSSLINSMADGVITIDSNGCVELYNESAVILLNSDTTMYGELIADLMRLKDSNNQDVDIQDLITQATKPKIYKDFRLFYDERDFINIYINLAPVKLGYSVNDKKGFMLVLRDITKEKSLEEKRDEFIGIVSHELRTPVTIAEGSIGNMELLLDKFSVNNQQIKQAVSQTHQQIQFLSGLINNLATLSKAESGKLEVGIEQVNMRRITEELIENFKPKADAKSLNLDCSVDPEVEILHSNNLYVREILQNIITNAIKYTSAGHVHVNVRQKDKQVEINVSDSGIGISKSDQEKIFDKFFRSEDYRTRSTSGTGLGLYLTEKLAKLIHADIKLFSKLNEGTTFTILIPDLK